MSNKEASSKKVELPKEVESKLKSLKTTSNKVRYLASLNMDRGKIAKILGIRYQHVRNVLVTPVAKPTETF